MTPYESGQRDMRERAALCAGSAYGGRIRQKILALEILPSQGEWQLVTAEAPPMRQLVLCTDGVTRWLDRRIELLPELQRNLSGSKRLATHYFVVPQELPYPPRVEGKGGQEDLGKETSS